MGCGQSTKVSAPNLDDNSSKSPSHSKDETEKEELISTKSSSEEEEIENLAQPKVPIIQTDTVIQDTFNRLPLPPIKQQQSSLEHSPPPSQPPSNANLPPLKQQQNQSEEDDPKKEAPLPGLQEKITQKCVRIAEGFSLMPNDSHEDKE